MENPRQELAVLVLSRASARAAQAKDLKAALAAEIDSLDDGREPAIFAIVRAALAAENFESATFRTNAELKEFVLKTIIRIRAGC